MESVGCWIIGDALDRGLAKIAGEAVAEYVEAYGGDTLLAIGVTPMHNLKFKHIFNTNASIIYYPAEDDETVTDPKMTLVQKYCAKHFQLDKNYNCLLMVTPQKEEKQQVDLEEIRQTQMGARNGQLIQTRVAVERMVIGWKTTAQEKSHSSTMVTSESTHGTVQTLSETTAPGQPSKQPKFRATVEPPSPPSVSLKPSKSTPSQRKSGQVTPQIADLLKTPVETPATGQKEEGSTNFFSEAGKRLSRRMSRLSTGSITSTLPSKPVESETVKVVLEKEPMAMQIPICGILAGGDRWSLHQVYASMTINHCPFGSGGAASIISNVVDFSSFMANLGEEMSEDEVNYKIASILDEQDEQDLGAFYLRERKPPEKPIVSSARLNSSDVTPLASSRRSSHISFMMASPKIHHQPPKATLLNLSDYMDEVLILRKMIEELNHLVSVFDMDDTDMDGYVISALLSSAGLETPLNVLNTEQLEVTIRLNRADIAKEKIFTEGRHWKRHGLDNFMFDAILNDQEAFVSLFVENGFDLEAFLTVHTLEKLYTASMLKRDSKVDTVRQIWEACRIYKMEWVMLRDVGRIVKHLLGEFYRPHYLSKHYRKMIKKAVTQYEAEEKEKPVTGNPWTSKKGSYFGPLSPRSSDTQKSSEGEKTPSPRTPRPSTTLIVNSLSHDSTAASHIMSHPNGKPSGIIVNGNGRYRKLGVVVPLGNENSLFPDESRRGKSYDSANDSNSRSIRRFLGNDPRHFLTNEGDIWSRAPVVMEEDFDVKTKFIHKPRESSRRLSLDGHVNGAYQRSKSEMSSLNEKGSTYSSDASESKRSDEQAENKFNNTEKRKGEKVDQIGAELSTTADPPSTTSMDDTLSAMRKTSFAGRHRGHHRLAVGKLSAAERARLISAEVRRREAAKAEEKERKRRHRLAQDKRTLYERICGINSQRFAAMQKVRLERPARELMLLCILFGKLELAALFWGYEKEPIGGAMFCTLLLGKLAAVCTDISQKLEFERYARIFESKAEEVLEACYAEDNQRAKMLLYRKLQEYGHSAVIRLAARGGCIHFMSHPCCQDFLSEVWMGKLSSKTTNFQSRLSTGSITSTLPSKPVESETVKVVLEKEPMAMQIPICGILAGGDRWSLHQVYASMTINHCPFGSGGAASIISNVVDFSSFMANLGEEMSEDEVNYKIASILDEQDEQDLGAFYLRERKPPEKPIVSSARLNSSDVTPLASSRRSSHISFMMASPKIHHQPPKATLLNLSDYMDEVLILRKMIEELNHLVSVFDMDDTDMDGYVISALLSSAGLETPLNVLNTEQLEVTIRLNRADIAKEKIFTEGRHWKRHGLDNFMFDAILNDQEAFVSLFVENGFDLEAFLTVHTLEKLYTASMLKRDSKVDTVRQIWEACRIYKMEWVMLRDVGRIVKHLLGEFYRPHYLSKHYRKMIKKAVTQYEAEEKEKPVTGNPWTSKKGSYFGPLSPRSSDTQKSSEGEKTPSPRTPRPSTTLIVNSLSHDSTAASHIMSHPNGKPSGIIVNGNGRYRKLGVVVPLGNENSLFPDESRRGKSYDSANDSNSRSIRRFLGNDPRHFLTNEGDIWSRAPVVMEEDFDVKTKFIHKPRESSRRLSLDGHVNGAYQRSKSEMSSLNEKGSTYSSDASESKRSDEQAENKFNNTEKRKGEKVDQIGAELSTTADPPSTTSMDDTLSAMRKTSFAGRHRGHHRLAVGKLSAAERARLISAEVRRREAAKAEEKERKRRHRLAQDKRTLYERICGINSQRFAAMQKVRLERPARELMLLCILFGKLELAALFWGYEKEPIGGAMFCTLLLGKLAAVCTDISQKLEFERYARIFESKAEEVLEACYAEDNQRAKMLLYRKLQEYGHSAVIRLAARGGCIHFMSHPCCQDFLSEVWMGKLSSKTTNFQLILGSIFGLVFPLILPQVLSYARNDAQNNLLGIDDSDSSDIDDDEGGEENATFSDNLDYSTGRRKQKASPTLLNSPRHWFHRQIKDIIQFYQAPVTRFLYNTIFYVAFLLVFSSMVLRNLKISFTIPEILTSLMVVALLLEELKQAFGPGASLKEYLSDGWNKVDCAAIGLYIGGFILRTLSYVQVRNVDLVEARRKLIAENATCTYVTSTTLRNASYSISMISTQTTHLDLPTQMFAIPEWTLRCVEELDIDNPYFLLHEERFVLARVMFALSLFAFFVRLMYIFGFSIVLGPKLIMINRMVVNDLLPFLLLLVVIQAGYGVSSFVISYPNGYYTTYLQNTLSRNMTLKYMRAGKIVYEFFMTAYFQMLGNFGLDILAGEDNGCRDNNLCPQFSSRRLSIITLSSFILLTQLLMLNLLVATFTSTYFEIEGSSTYFWSYQRYEMIQECVDRPSVAPPFTLLWYSGEVIYAAFQRLLGLCPGLDDFEQELADDPFCRNFRGNPSLKSKLMKWEFMKAQNVLRSQMDSDLPVSRRTEAARSTIITMRGLKGPGGAGAGGGGGAGEKRGSVLLGIEDLPNSLFGPDSDLIEGRFASLSTQVEKVSNFEDRLKRIATMMKRITVELKKVHKSANQTAKFLDGGEGRRLVGAPKSAISPKPGSTPRSISTMQNEQTRSHIISNAIKEAVMNLSSHCLDIEEQIEEKLRIESLCIKAILTNPDASDIPPDSVMKPPTSQPGPPSRRPEAKPPSASIYERLIYSHRLWRLLPFNFERRPGMRVNIPNEMIDWKVSYPGYKPFIANTEKIAYPYPGVEDGPQIDPTKLQYNTYDELQGVSRSCLRGRVHISRDPTGPQGFPLNPRGRSGLFGKGLLPHWGPNHVIVLAFTRAGTSPNDFQVVVLDRDQSSCLPWFFVDHRESCDHRSCSAKVMRDFVQRRVVSVFGDSNPENETIKSALLESINKMEISLISDNFLDDHLNADHAWIENVCVNFHSSGDSAFHDAAVKVFMENPPIESARWFDFKGSLNLRSSHEPLLIAILQHHGKL
nr:transient receptor potential cation channel [Hymenolepis microstoma]